MRTAPHVAVMITASLFATACGETASSEAVSPGTDALTAPPREIAGGDYQLSVVTVDDGCLEGALELVFKPNGAADPYALQNPTTLPAPGALPSNGLIELEEPFTAMPVLWEAGADGALLIKSGIIADVLLGLATSPDCTADLRIDAEARSAEAGIAIDAAVTLTGVTSPTDTCPVIPDGCLVSIDLVGALVGTASR